MTQAVGSAGGLPEPDESALREFGVHLAVARAYGALLADDGVAHGHLGPREVPKLWARHLVNSARVAAMVPVGGTVVDVGSGAGLPGLPMAICRPDLTLVLLEPMQRRVDFLERCIATLGLVGRVLVTRGRAGDPDVGQLIGGTRWVVARAVAPLDRLVGWCAPLLTTGGRLLALKGSSAADEVREHGPAVARAGMRVLGIEDLGDDDGRARVVVVERVAAAARSTRGGRQR